ncbi:peptidase domain-containing ABC transporter [Pseudomonas lundensis]|uniref:peptidase domain-containing ABC transporter n=1 Tax=Serratia proteamaculans TaxID=28151 RepID=UPI00298250B1|nr:peptidase domain-containing ABC transporter [Serratia proteamaculans]MDW5499262.1 peptidase domain-containing ABC transporter [Serratia proteamaculans]MDW5504324.1 peptidase domain-containing ABC transporter [Pseudomonas lundensis]
MDVTEMINWSWRKRLPLIRQTESAECGVACLAMIAGWHGHRVDLPTLRAQFNVSQLGMTFSQLMSCAEQLHLSGRAVQLELEELHLLSLPCILYWDMNHFTVLKRVRGQTLELHDPARGQVKMSLREADRHFTGVAMELTPTHQFAVKDQRKKIRLMELIGKTQGLKAALGRIFCLALTLEVFALIGPLINQLVIDEVLVALDASLLTLIVIAMLLMAATQMLLELARQWATLTMAVNFNMQWTANVFHHLLRLPISWFEARNMGDIGAKFDAVDTIQDTLTTTLLEAFLDVLLVVGTLTMMFFYSAKLTLVALAAALIYGLLRWFWFCTLRKAAEDSWVAGTQESSHFLESLRESKLMMVYGIMQTVIGSVVGAAVLWLGASAVLAGQFSVGMLVAYMSFQGRFSSSINGLIDKLVAYRMLDVYNERLADIVLAVREDAASQAAGGSAVQTVASAWPSDQPALSLEQVSFKYAGTEREILSQVSLQIMPGEVVALVGASGSGKTTLAKLVLGLYPPTSGVIRTLGIEHRQADYQQIRQHIGVVLQEDQLFRGSIAENLTFFSSRVDKEKLGECVRLAQLAHDIEKLPMGYQTLIGEMGGTLSAGQKQRLLLARALYKQPRLLILDEATSHLDVNNEMLIGRTLRQLGLPILLIAHRPETIASADRVIELAAGQMRHLDPVRPTARP